MGEKNNQEVTLFADGKPVGFSKDVKMSSAPTQPNGDMETYRNMSEKQCVNISFEIACDEKARDFILRMEKERKAKEDAIMERIESLFKEFVGIESKLNKEEADEANKQLLGLFSIGYSLGWNDYYNLNQNK